MGDAISYNIALMTSKRWTFSLASMEENIQNKANLVQRKYEGWII